MSLKSIFLSLVFLTSTVFAESVQKYYDNQSIGSLPKGSRIILKQNLIVPEGKRELRFNGYGVNCVARVFFDKKVAAKGTSFTVDDVETLSVEGIVTVYTYIGGTSANGSIGIQCYGDSSYEREACSYSKEDILNRAFSKGISFDAANEQFAEVCARSTKAADFAVKDFTLSNLKEISGDYFIYKVR